MSLLVNLRHLERKDLVLNGELSASDLDLEKVDSMIAVTRPVRYSLTVQRLGDQLLAQGAIHAVLDCDCVRCLKHFEQPLDFEDWACSLALAGEDKVPVTNDCVDLTPWIREDILLEFPQHPLCEQSCAGLPKKGSDVLQKENESGRESAWSELNKLKF